MQLILRGHTIELNDKEVELAKKSLSKYLSSTKSACISAGRPTYYYTLLLVAYVLVNDVFDTVDLNMMEHIFAATNKKQQ